MMRSCGYSNYVLLLAKKKMCKVQVNRMTNPEGWLGNLNLLTLGLVIAPCSVLDKQPIENLILMTYIKLQRMYIFSVITP